MYVHAERKNLQHFVATLSIHICVVQWLRSAEKAA